jgi:acetyltransferase-like isoleucine patch superfamily enzyme
MCGFVYRVKTWVNDLFLRFRRRVRSWFLRLYLRRRGVVFGRNLEGNCCSVQVWGRIVLGDDVKLVSFPDGEVFKTCLVTWRSSSLIKVGSNCLLNGVVIQCRCRVVVGDNCMFGAGSVVLDSDFHSLSVDAVVRRGSEGAVDGAVVLGDNVWVGRNVVILKGVCIGDNSVIAAGSVVTGCVPANQLFGGNPARFIKNLTK